MDIRRHQRCCTSHFDDINDVVHGYSTISTMLYMGIRRHKVPFDLNLVGRIIVVSIYVQPPPMASACGCSFSVPHRPLCTSLFCDLPLSLSLSFLKRNKGVEMIFSSSFALFHHITHSPPLYSGLARGDEVSEKTNGEHRYSECTMDGHA